MQDHFKIPQNILDLINQLFEVEKKVNSLDEQNSIGRNLEKLKSLLEAGLFNMSGSMDKIGFVYHNPLGEEYSETRTDCDATISGSNTDNLTIVEVIKPIIRYKSGPMTTIVQKAVVIVQSKNI
jgi:hypothetical protein